VHAHGYRPMRTVVASPTAKIRLRAAIPFQIRQTGASPPEGVELRLHVELVSAPATPVPVTRPVVSADQNLDLAPAIGLLAEQPGRYRVAFKLARRQPYQATDVISRAVVIEIADHLNGQTFGLPLTHEELRRGLEELRK